MRPMTLLCSAAVANTPPTISAEFKMLTPADNSCSPLCSDVHLNCGKQRHDEQPSGAGQANNIDDAMRTPMAELKKTPTPTSALAVGRLQVDRPRSIRNTAIPTAASGTGRSKIRPLALKGRRERANPNAKGEERADRGLDANSAAGLVANDDRGE